MIERSALELPASSIREIAKLAEGVPGALKLFFGESNVPTPRFLRDAAKKALDEGYTFYTANAGYAELREAISEKERELHGVSYSPDEIVVTGGGVMAIYLAARACFPRGAKVAVVSPSWPNIPAIVRMVGAEAVEVPLVPAGDKWELDADALERGCRGAAGLVVNSPSNPTGWVASDEEMERIARAAVDNDLVLLADEVYERLHYGASPRSFCELDGLRPRLVLVNSFSKTYCMTGWRVGYACCPEDLARVVAKLQEYVASHAPSVSQRAAIVALRSGEGFIEECRERYLRARELCVRELGSIEGVETVPPAGTFYVFPRLEGVRDSFEFAKALLLEKGVGVAPGSAFGECGEGYLRLCIAVDEETLREALARLGRFVGEWRERCG